MSTGWHPAEAERNPGTMTSWTAISAEEPDLADRVRRCFRVRKHATMATLRRDGSPRISGTEVEFDVDGEIYLGMMPGSLKARDLRRDPRISVHSPTEDAPEEAPASWLGDAKLAGRAVEVSDPERDDEPHRFRIDVDEVVVTSVADGGEHLEIRSWHPGRGLEIRNRP